MGTDWLCSSVCHARGWREVNNNFLKSNPCLLLYRDKGCQTYHSMWCPALLSMAGRLLLYGDKGCQTYHSMWCPALLSMAGSAQTAVMLAVLKTFSDISLTPWGDCSKLDII